MVGLAYYNLYWNHYKGYAHMVRRRQGYNQLDHKLLTTRVVRFVRRLRQSPECYVAHTATQLVHKSRLAKVVTGPDISAAQAHV